MMNQKQLTCLVSVLLASVLAISARGQDKESPKKGEPQPSEAEMMAKMWELAKPGENHKLLARTVGTWSYKIKMWMGGDTSAPPNESSGTCVTKEVLGGRYFISEHSGKMQMPGPDGKMTDLDFKGIATDGYDNVKKKFIATWIDNLGTGMMISEGTYDAATKTFTYHTESEMIPGMKTKIREVIKIIDNDNHLFEFYEDRVGTEVKTMEIAYKRKK